MPTPHLDPRTGLARGLRAAALTVPTVGAAVIAHSMADGCGSLVGIGVAVGVAWPGAVALLGARRGLPSFVAWVLVVQALTHVLLERLCPEVMTGQSGVLEHALNGLTPAMLLAHGVSVVATAVLIGRSDQRLWAAHRLRRAARRAVPVLAFRPVPAVPTHLTLVPTPVERTWTPVLGAGTPLRRRGPPVAATR